MTGKYEFSVYNKDELIYDMKKLQELGIDVKYVPKKKKKKPEAKPKEDTPKAESKEEKPETKVETEAPKSNPEENQT
jgi:formate hydrogenlyase subunit 6/NADH:ubiquinone oxidoreductase subunit I